MAAFITKHSTIILMSGLAIILILAWIFPAAGLKLGIAFLLWTFFVASLAVLEKHKNAYRRGEMTQRVFIRNGVLEISGTFLVMLLAGLLGRQAAEAATQQIGDGLLRSVAGIVVGLLVGMSVGGLAKKTLRRLVDTPRRIEQKA
jgi:hypothetical protein